MIIRVRVLLLHTIIPLLVLFSSGCVPEQDSLPNGKFLLPFVQDHESSDSVEGYFLVQQNRDSIFRDNEMFSSINYGLTAEFNDTYGVNVDVGTVSFKNVNLGTPDGGNLYSTPRERYISGSSPTYSVQYSGLFDKYQITGGNGWSAFLDSMVSPNGQMIITSPCAGDSISVSSTLTVTWANSGDTNSHVVVIVHDTTPHSAKLVGGDAGTIAFTPGQLSSFSGPGYILAHKYTYKYGNTSSRTYGIVNVTSHRKNVVFKP